MPHPRCSLLVALPVSLLLLLAACHDEGPPLVSPPQLNLANNPVPSALTPKEALGKAIFFDKSLSLHQNQACAACHGPEFGFTGPTPGVNRGGSVYMGSVRYRAGNRKPPSAAYATLSPPLHFDDVDEVWVGGNFWDGRATGDLLGNPAADQALGPFLNPVEQALPDAICVLYRIATGSYADLWETVWVEDLRDLPYPTRLDKTCRSEEPIEYDGELAVAVDRNYGRVGLSIEAYEASSEVNAFSSKYDAYLAGMAELTEEEALGLELFNGKANCAACHPSEGPNALFTDFTYDNLGVPANPLNPVYDTDPGFVDRGLGGYLGNAEFDGAVKVPTLRNLAKAPGSVVKAYGHNGVFKSIEQIVHFYNTRDVLPQCAPGEVKPNAAGLAMMGFSPECWPAPEVADNVNQDELGNLELTPAEEHALVAFLRTLSDGWRP
ncbi:MAG: cytochrome c peroxidase [Gemmatimonadota bacterium]